MDDYLSKPISRAALAAVLAALAPPPPTAPPREEGVTVAKTADAAPGKPLLVLVADDNLANQRVAEAQLGALGCAVDIAGDGTEALAAVESKAYDIVFMDMQMPRMDGLEATRRICARWEAGARPRIVGMTAEPGEEARRSCLGAGMDDCISKPIARAELAKLLAATPRRT
jgi:CheY-like chemotaxis protein